MKKDRKVQFQFLLIIQIPSKRRRTIVYYGEEEDHIQLDGIVAAFRNADTDFDCPYCGRVFGSKAGLARHLVVHEGWREHIMKCKQRTQIYSC